MKRSLAFLVSFLIVITSVSTGFASGAYARLDGNVTMKTYFVAFKSSIDHGLIKAHGGELKREYTHMPVVSVKLSDKAAVALVNNPNVEYVEEDAKVQVIGQVSPWGITDVKADDVQQKGITGSGVKIGIIDSGIDYTHEDLHVSGGVTFVQGTTTYLDDNGHGTHVAGTVAALNNTVGVLGVAPQVNLYSIKVLNQYGDGNYSDVVAGIEWAITNHMNIINMSLGGNTDSRTLRKAVDNAYNTGILIVASAGNNSYDKKGTIAYPAKYESVIAVGAVDELNGRANFSSVGRELELMAPGVGIQSSVPGGYAYYSGTSMAAPHVTGVAALLLEAKPGSTNIELRNTLDHSAYSLGDTFLYGNGLVDAFRALNYVQNLVSAGEK